MLPDDVLMAIWKQLPLAARLARNRLLYAFQLWNHGPGLLWHYLCKLDACQVPTWLTALRQAFDWAHQVDPQNFPDAVHVQTCEQIQTWLSQHVEDGPRLVHRMVAQYLAQQHALALVRTWHERLYSIAEDMGVTFQATPDPQPSAPVCGPCCDLCGLQFGSSQQLSTHLWTAHQVISDERAYMDSAVCRACQFCYWTPARLQQHLHYSRRFADGCFAQLTWNCSPAKNPVRFGLPDHLRGHHRVPRVQVASVPVSPDSWFQTRLEADAHLNSLWSSWSLPARLDRDLVQHLATWVPSLITVGSATSDALPDDLLHELLTWIDAPATEHDRHVRAWAVFEWRHKVYLAAHFPEVPRLHLARLMTAIDEVIEAIPICQLLLWQRRMDNAYIPDAPHPPAPVVRWVKEPIPYWTPIQLEWLATAAMRQVISMPSPQGVPVHVDDDGSLLCGVKIDVLSLDTAVCPRTGNLAAGPNFDRILNLAKCGLFTASIAGPPCETWSAVRNVPAPPDSSRRFPRPLRTASQPWCLAGRTPRESHQTSVGSSLMGHTWMIETPIVLHGGAAVKEHPAPPADSSYASVWRVPTHEELLMRMPGAFEHVIEQWKFDAQGVKPTTLRALGCGDPQIFSRALFEHADQTLARPLQGLVGRDQQGSWRTSRAKEYPTRLCRAMSWALIRSLCRRLDSEGFSPASFSLSQGDREWLAEAQLAAATTATRDTWLPDFQG
eukprot:Skav229770  [mRNA]  locus=scaffold4146:25243:27494:+ [translate_table: standard]